MGLLRDGINEVIATTAGNAAPMGIICRDGPPRIVAYRGSHTAERIRNHGWLVANFTFDPVIYVRTAFQDLPPEYFVSEQAAGFTVQRLADVEAWAAFSARVAGEGRESFLVELALLREEVCIPGFHPVNRGFNSVIEAAVHATRYVRTGDPELLQLIHHHTALVRKCGGAREMEALRILEENLAQKIV